MIGGVPAALGSLVVLGEGAGFATGTKARKLP